MSNSLAPRSEQSRKQQSDPLAPSVEELYLESYAFTTAAAIVGSVDRKIFVLLRDGRNLFGILRTFDQFANVVLQDTVERIYLNSKNDNLQIDKPQRYGEINHGVFMIRGENVVMLGELDIDNEDDHLQQLERIPFDEAERELKELHSERIKEESAKSKKLLSKGLVNDFMRFDLY